MGHEFHLQAKLLSVPKHSLRLIEKLNFHYCHCAQILLLKVKLHSFKIGDSFKTFNSKLILELPKFTPAKSTIYFPWHYFTSLNFIRHCPRWIMSFVFLELLAYAPIVPIIPPYAHVPKVLLLLQLFSNLIYYLCRTKQQFRLAFEQTLELKNCFSRSTIWLINTKYSMNKLRIRNKSRRQIDSHKLISSFALYWLLWSSVDT